MLEIVLPAFLGLLLFGLIIFGYILPWAEDTILAKKKEMIRELTNTVWTILKSYQDQAEAGFMSPEEARRRACERIRNIRYGPQNKDYFWISDMKARVIMHPYQTELEGRDQSGYTDPQGKRLFVEFARIVEKQKAGYVDYYWQWKDDPDLVLPKVSYVRGFEPWGWIIGTGIYVRDVEAEMAAMTRGLTLASLGVLAAVSILSGFLVVASIRAARGREETHLALMRKGEEYRAVLEAAPDPMVVYDIQGRATYINPAFARLFGWSPGELLGKRIDFVPEEEREATRAGIRLLFESEASYVPIESRRSTKDGRILDVVINASIIRGLNNAPAGLVVNLKDVTEQKKSERALLESEKRFRDLINSVSDIIYIHDLEGRIISANESLSRILGYSPEESVGRPLADFMMPEWRPAFYDQYLPRTIAEGNSEGVTVYVGNDGAKHFLEYRSVLVYEGSKPVHISGSGRDVTDRVMARKEVERLEENLRHAQKMEAVGTLAGGVAHDFNNLLQIIGGYVQLLTEETRPGSDQEEILGRIQGAVERAGDLVRRLLTFSRKLEPGLKPLDLNHQIRQAVKIVERTLPKRIVLATDLGDDLSPILGDPNQIEQVLLNLVTNARDAMPEGGRIDIATRERELDEQFCSQNPGSKPGFYIEQIFSDNGQGMDGETIEHIFDPFYTTKGVGQGTGLGLATVYGIVKSHHGYISCESEPGRGTSFRIFWPVTEVPVEVSAPAEESREVRGGRETILIVDDEKDVLEIGRAILKSRGYPVQVAGSGEEALELYGRGERGIDLIIMDLGMPGMGGQKALGEILARDPSAKVIIASGYTTDERVQASLEAGAKAFIPKPYRLVDMTETIRRVLDENG